MRVICSITVLALALAGCGDEPTPGDGGGLDAATPVADAGDADVAVCAADSECDDDLYCTGAERCRPGDAGAGPDGCVAGEPPCDAAAGETCDEATAECTVGSCEGEMADLDGDGDDRIECGGSDCDDSNPSVYGTAQEICDEDGVDEDCDPSTIRDDTPMTGDGDGDGDGFVDTACFNPRADGGENRGTDCNDGNATIHPGVLDGCNGVDDDCDGEIDEDPDRTFYEDIDGDGHGVISTTVTACAAPPGFAVLSDDCDDTNRNINPGAGEPCNGIDDDCSGVADDPAAGSCSCVDGRTQDCGPTTEVGACTFGTSTCVGGEWGPCVGAVGRMAEICNGADDDCDGDTDDADADISGASAPCPGGSSEYWRDLDGDGVGTDTDAVCACVRPSGYVSPGAEPDCDDTEFDARPGNVESSFPCDMIDNDCDGTADEAGTDALECYPDDDGDGYGREGSTATSVCHACPADSVPNDADCRDDLPDVHPDVTAYHGLPACPPGQSYGFCMRGGGLPGSGVMSLACSAGGSCTSSPPHWDYDCSGVIETEPTGTACRMSGMFCVGERGPESGVTSAECGLPVTHTGGCSRSFPGGFPCSTFTQPDSSESLRCR